MSNKIAIYPGSFNPFHRGHADILNQASKLYDAIYVAIGINKDKVEDTKAAIDKMEQVNKFIEDNRIIVHCEVQIASFSGLLKDFVTKTNAIAVIKGLRDSNDFLYEQKMQYVNEDLGITVPTVYLISNRNLVHVSSSAVRALKAFE